METLKLFTVFYLVLALLACTVERSSGESFGQVPFSKWRIHVSNDMSRDSLFLHCKSRDDDLGQQNLAVGQEFSWGFRENIWQTTLYWCYIHNANSHSTFEVFWPENSDWLAFRCKLRDCNWSVRDEGVYLKTNTHDTYELLHNWEPGQ